MKIDDCGFLYGTSIYKKPTSRSRTRKRNIKAIRRSKRKISKLSRKTNRSK